MQPKYIFISNGTKPTRSERSSRAAIRITNFSRPCLEAAREMGYTVYLGVNRDHPEQLEDGSGIKYYDSSTYRSLLDIPSNIRAASNLLRLLREGGVEVIHCNTPIGGVIGRICGRLGRVDKIVYTAHGFHFYNGGGRLRNALYRTAESLLAHLTDCIITINSEDYEAASKFALRGAGKVYQVPGVGIDVSHFSNERADRASLRRELDLPKEAFIFVSVGDLIQRKDYLTAIRALGGLEDPDSHLVICGSGPERPSLESSARDLGVAQRVHFLGQRDDIARILKASDSYLFTSKQEGLPRSVMEAMASGLPCIVSRIRGNVDLVTHGEGGFLCPPGDVLDFSHRMEEVRSNPQLSSRMGMVNRVRAEKYDVSSIRERVLEIYEDVLK